MSIVTEEEFEQAIQDGIDSLPQQFLDDMVNVAIVAQDEPTQDDFDQLDEDGTPAGIRQRGELLGLYTGVPITERYFDDFEGEAPDMIQIFKGPHERCFPNHDDLLEQVKRTVAHEVGHYFGLDDDRLHQLGL